MDSETVTERTIDPESRVAISLRARGDRARTRQGTNPGVTVASNLPDGDVSGEAGGNSRNATQSRERQNFEVSETRREKVIAPGQVRRVSVAVMVDGVTATDAQGVETWAPRPETEIEMLRELVQSAIGFDAARGDVVTIQSLQFTLPPAGGALAEAGSGFIAANGARLIQLGVLAAVVLALIFFVLRPLAARRPVLEITELTGPRELAPAPARLGGADAAGGDILDLPAQSVTKIERLRDVISSRTEDSAAVLRSWIESPEPRKEPAGS